ncbi:MAG: glutamate--tRNA ligase [Deltaproteobacteria bacterium]|nr:glutamate--tRNA ligase [Deltaproteobacteria bacterium]
MPEVRTRFAPSPTGHLHVGGARTALFNYLFARHHGGSFVLRIEDTDRERSSDESVQAIMSGLDWLGVVTDEGPHFQSKRGELYDKAVAELLGGGHAYWCVCSQEKLAATREAALASGKKAMYDRSCRGTGHEPALDRPAVLRLASPESGETTIDDLVRGPVTFDNSELDDLVLLRSDGSPTFHLVVVVDDIDMGITHVLRGEDHLTNTPRQVQIFRSLGQEPPRYGHLPLIVGADRSRLSKRHGATSLDAYREMGILPGAMANYLARLGWSHGDQEIFSSEELSGLFDVEGVGKAAAAFDLEKLRWVNQQHIKAAPPAELAVAVLPFLGAGEADDASRLEMVVELLAERAVTLVELAEGAHCFLSDDLSWDRKAVARFLDEEGLARLSALAQQLERLADWDESNVEAAFAAALADLDVKLGKLAQPARVALTGSKASPGIYEVCVVLGRKRTLARLQRVAGELASGDLPLTAPAG